MSTSSTVLFTDLNLCSRTYIKGYFLILSIEMTTPTTKTSLFTKSNWILIINCLKQLIILMDWKYLWLKASASSTKLFWFKSSFSSSDLLLSLNPPHVSHLILISDLVILIALHVIFYFFRHNVFYFVSYVW